MKAILYILISLVSIVNCDAQFKHDYIWLAGHPTPEIDPLFGVNIFDFNGGSLNILKQPEGLNSFVTNASICDHDGNLLFYSNGCSINNAQHELMENGNNLNFGYSYLSGNCPDYGNTCTKGIMILPLPNSDSLYYVIHKKYEAEPDGELHIGKLLYTTVDMSLDGGLGAVIAKNKVIIDDTLHSGDLHAVKHANNEDWWILSCSSRNNTYYRVLIDASGVSSVDTQNIGTAPDAFYNNGGNANFSPDGTKYARYTKGDQLVLFDFDRSSGLLSNFQQFYVDTTEGFWGGLSFSSNSRFLYVNTQFRLWQFDLAAPDIAASKVMVGEWDGFYDENNLSVMFYLMQLGPDCKIYMVAPNGTRHMHVINSPDQPGLACDFRQRGVTLPAINGTSIPNFPNYRLGTGYPVCDSNIVYVSSGYVPPPVEKVRVWPNPATSEVTVSLPSGTGPGSFTLYDATGRQLRSWALSAGQQEARFGLEGLPQGMYFWQAERKGKALGSGKLIIQKD
jgi:hypothetical protein